jgi:hypothetical protein
MYRTKRKRQNGKDKCFFSVFPLLFCLFFLASCSFQRVVVNDPITPERVTFITRGETSMQEVITVLGAPQEITNDGTQNIFRYQYRVSKSFRINFGVFLRLITPASIPLSTLAGNTRADIFEVAFDRTGIVQEYTFRLQSKEAKFNPWPF